MECRVSKQLSLFMDLINLNHSAERARWIGTEEKPSQTQINGSQFVAGIKGQF
jgi:hypothetical protein